MVTVMNIGSRAQVWRGTAKKTRGGLTKKKLKKTKHGRIVSRKKSEKVKKGKGKSRDLKEWNKCVKVARRQLGIEGFVPIGGKSKAGKELLKAVRECYYN